VTDFKAGDRVRLTRTAVHEGDVVDWPHSPTGLAVKMSHGGLYWIEEDGKQSYDFVHTFELIAPAEPPVGSVLVDSDGDVWHRISRGWTVAGSDFLGTWAELQVTGPFTVLREGWGE
jgi:hypothetical protein